MTWLSWITLPHTKSLVSPRRLKMRTPNWFTCRRTVPISIPSNLPSRLKSLLRRAGERTIDRLETKIATLLENFSNDECCNDFRHCG